MRHKQPLEIRNKVLVQRIHASGEDFSIRQMRRAKLEKVGTHWKTVERFSSSKKIMTRAMRCNAY
ncbi:hypothetical protein [Janthinobacterium sp. CAN_S7]|uniref:hypothetical protein n=1 Tax=Janthinobacterium sp. CAN_S7 TaxID=3071704 RepID=UPI00319E1104